MVAFKNFPMISLESPVAPTQGTDTMLAPVIAIILIGTLIYSGGTRGPGG